MRACTWGAVTLRSILFGIIRLTGRDPLPHIDFVRGFFVYSPAQVAGAPSRDLGRFSLLDSFLVGLLLTLLSRPV